MQFLARGRLPRKASTALLVLSAACLAACSSAPEPKAMIAKKQRSKEYFAESEYGVKASPRVSTLKSRLPRGGGREQVGKPYKVRGKWYYPKEVKGYRKVGTASWYGDAFHGRLTANGEIYDMTHLTAAHPTMPLPSYARVTNADNGSSVIVRVNDRGPYSGGRIIDLSKRAAEMLDYTHSGTAKVKVEYVGRAPLEGHDDSYLMASYRPGNRAPDPSDGLPDGVMIAMNGSSPSYAVAAARPAVAFPGELTDTAAEQPVPAFALTADSGGDILLPAFGPIAPERPGFEVMPGDVLVASATMSYAGERVSRATQAFAALDGGGMSDDEASPRRRSAETDVAPAFDAYVAAGSFESAAQAADVAGRLARFGRVEVEHGDLDGAIWHTVNLYPRAGSSVDDALQAAWDNGATEAFAVRN